MDAAVLMDSMRCEALWRRHADRLLLYATTLHSDRAAAEDALQNVFVRLLSSWVPAMESEASYLFRAVRNEALNASRSRRRLERATRPFFEGSGAPDPGFAEEAEAALRALAAEEREAVVLKIWGDLSFPEAAAVAGISEKAFEHRYYQALATLKQKMGVRDE